ncbi:hypothetical protein DMH17_16040 [Raoultella planticola]|nr:hypothetical protein [Raoultella planticola]
MAAFNSKVRKAVIPVAGLGTRMLPATKAIPKEMLPLVDKPLIQYVVNECIAAGITEIVLVTHSSKTPSKTISIPVLNWKRCWKNVLNVSCWKKFSPFVRRMCHHYAGPSGLAKGSGPRGTARTRWWVTSRSRLFCQTLFWMNSSRIFSVITAEMISRFDETGSSQIMVEPVADVTAYGVVDCKGESRSRAKAS